jgi:hypothetical protein
VSIGSWSLDHLLVDQEGILTLVETKLAENPESRREVIGQVLEYAANAEASWRDGRLQERAAAYWTKQGKDVNDVLRQQLGIHKPHPISLDSPVPNGGMAMNQGGWDGQEANESEVR